MTSLLAAGAIASACGSGSPGVASVGSTTTTTIPAANPGGSTAGLPTALVDFSRCMQKHGLPNFPLPVRTGPNSVGIRVSPSNTGPRKNSPVFQAAQAACQHYLPAGGQAPKITTKDQADYLKAVACMRSHGYPQFPDPKVSGSNVTFTVPSGINQQSPQFKSAVKTCEKLIPAGLPYSSTD